MDDRFKQLPSYLRDRAIRATLAGVPALIAVPDAAVPAPTMLWMHGRTVDKELDPGRYQRWLRAGIAAVALDLPGHGERTGPRLHGPEHTPLVLSQMIGEIDDVLGALANHEINERIDFDRLGIGGMSAGGMVTLRALCNPHRFRCAAVESTTGWLAEMYQPTLSESARWPVTHDHELVAKIDANNFLDSFRAIPLLALHSEADATVPWAGMRQFLDSLQSHYEHEGASRDLIEVTTWPETGAPYEHAGFGKVAAEAKNIQTDFLVRHLIGGEQ